MNHLMNRICVLLIFALAIGNAGASAPTISWRVLQPGVEYTSIVAGKMASGEAGRLYVVRIDPGRARVTAALASEEHGKRRTAAEWCRDSKLAVAINMGMFQNDGQSNVGYLRHGAHNNNARWNDYNSVLALNPADRSRPRALWIDRDQNNAGQQLANYEIVVQNLRLITASRRNVWSVNNKRWSEAAIAMDSKGRVLFLFTRAPWSMREFNELILNLPLDVAGAMHVEGGPEASLSIHTGGVNLDLAGSFETGFWPDDSNQKQWPIPNVLGVVSEK